MQSIWITGADGHIGTALQKLLNHKKYEILTTDKGDVDVTDIEQIRLFIAMNRPGVIINCAGVTDVKTCIDNPDLAFKVNALGARNLAVEAQKIGAKLVQISTDDVFDGNEETPYTEFDETHPISVYGKSKLAGEQMVRSLIEKFFIVRSSWVYDIGDDFIGRFLKRMETEKEIDVEVNRTAVPTSAKELAKVIAKLIEGNQYGTYHIVCQGSCTRYELAREVVKLVGKQDEVKVNPVMIYEQHTPFYTVLDNMMLRLSGIEEPRHWREPLKEYIDTYLKGKSAKGKTNS
jgi:dTDP-4-dehydrorhamnose reductase